MAEGALAVVVGILLLLAGWSFVELSIDVLEVDPAVVVVVFGCGEASDILAVVWLLSLLSALRR